MSPPWRASAPLGRGFPGAALLVALLGASCTNEDGRALHGQEAYDTYCALCHGAAGEGYAADNAPALSNAEFLRTATDEHLRLAIARGRPGTTMSAWSEAYEGPLDTSGVDSLVLLLRAWQRDAAVVPEPPVAGGDATRGATLFAARCVECHGDSGLEGPFVSVANPTFLATASDGFLAHAIRLGRPDTLMPSFESELTPDEVADLVALLRSWQRPIPPGDVLSPGAFGPMVQNPEGPEPAFTPGRRYTPADTVYNELTVHGARMVLLDARPPSSYAEGHISGAINLPFYDVERYASALPQDTWIVCYCACPHAESGVAMDALLGLGFTDVTILDEGVGVWSRRGYPMSEGNAP